MEWIESHTNLGDHPKVAELCFELMIKKHEAIGHLTLLWHFAMKYSWRVGDLSRFNPRIICQAVGWDKDPDTFINGLRTSGWIEKDGIVLHNWLKYAGKLVKDRLYQENRRLSATKTDSSRQSSVTVPYSTIPKTTTTPLGFEAFWNNYPKKIGKGAAERAWKKIPHSKQHLEKIMGAVAAQSRSEQWLKDGGQFIPHPATWLNQKRWEDEIAPKEAVIG